ncbi:tRNA (adenosine(37)-N6)-threonylcarbamoyltransferase complex dimerization subunit type 1 TsaB [Prochlorococcus sp. MIT 1307]|uniref:tRNA (adenosine(37)-N6)-threonylcarbamoyltransferase complex dimerization subunit type 1 TsaB n=1 Tax=Prochlorococcus sp. MIT 1307 TaxID=3096219 RepID=UPI002A754E1A|nr:tRNA (adenosine(37)-N6)-threonylcarbamoyltransferase complex dimerization subunit type 1 TsaB [Prochlorococcus sp. MIT 1307]
MKKENLKGEVNDTGNLLLALHSCSTSLGIAILDSRSPETSLSSKIFPLGRSLSNQIISCIEEVLPSSYWYQLGRISVAVGPGGFTGTRLTVAMARTLAQQLNCDLDGISSFALMAPRLSKNLKPKDRYEPFWIVDNLSRKGIVGGRYQIKESSQSNSFAEALELEKPQLLGSKITAKPSINASDDVAQDVVQLLNISLLAKQMGKKNYWDEVLPIYPTSPVKEC